MIVFENYPNLNIGSPAFVKDWLDRIAHSHNYVIKELIYTFVDNNRILDINHRFLDHDYFTDIITFDYCKGNKVSGEIFISLEQIEIQAEEFSASVENELIRVIAHGLLHLIGFDDKADGDRILMRMEEEKSLVLHAQMFGN